jgi:hypothetical protein
VTLAPILLQPNMRLKLAGLFLKGIGRSLAGVRRLRDRPPCARRHAARSLSAIR